MWTRGWKLLLHDYWVKLGDKTSKTEYTEGGKGR